jgi:CspA family cold shock protein
MKKGVVKFFNPKAKFGFIITPESKEEYYVHMKDVDFPIQTGDEVTFELKESPRGLQAVKVSKAV